MNTISPHRSQTTSDEAGRACNVLNRNDRGVVRLQSGDAGAELRQVRRDGWRRQSGGDEYEVSMLPHVRVAEVRTIDRGCFEVRKLVTTSQHNRRHISQPFER